MRSNAINWQAQGLVQPRNAGATYPIGTRFKTRGKASRICTVVDVLTTRNSAGEIVKVRYVATHEFCGQTVTNRDVCGTTIAMGQESGK